MKRNETPSEEMTGDEALAVAVATSPTVAEAARRAGVSRATIYRRFANDVFFPGMVQDVRQAVAAARMAKAAQVADEATDALLAILHDADVGPGVRVRAATALLAKYS